MFATGSTGHRYFAGRKFRGWDKTQSLTFFGGINFRGRLLRKIREIFSVRIHWECKSLHVKVPKERK